MTCRCPDAEARERIRWQLRQPAQRDAFLRDLQVIHAAICREQWVRGPDYSHEWLMKMRRRGLKTLRTHGYLAFEETAWPRVTRARRGSRGG